MMIRPAAKFFLPVLILLIAGGTYYSLVNSKTVREKPALTEKIWLLDVIAAKTQDLSPSIKLYGRIESPELLQAAAPGGGIIDKVLVRNGSRVRRGQRLVTMDRRDFDAALLQATADLNDINNQVTELEVKHRANIASLATERELLALASAEVDRLVELKKQNLSADTQLNSAHSELARQQLAVTSRALDVDSFPAQLQMLKARQDRAGAQLDQAKLAMTRSKVRAPFDGIISDVAIASGDRVSLGQLLVSLFPIDSLEIRAHLPANYIRSIQRAIADGQHLEARVSDHDGLARVPLSRLAGAAETTGLDVYFALGANNQQLRPGELLPLQLQLPAEAGVYALPYQAIYGNSRIYRVIDDRLQATDVETVGQARDANGQVLVLIRSDSIQSGDLIAVTHLPNAVSGLKVKASEL